MSYCPTPGQDTIKSKMQIQSGFIGSSSLEVAQKIWRHDGVRGFFKGCVPPLWGSMVYRGLMISSYELSYTFIELNCDEGSFWRRECIFGMLRPQVPLSSAFAACIRIIVESPIEYAKVMGQTGQPWQVRHVYRGFWMQALRTTSLLIPIYSAVDVSRRKTNWMNTLFGGFLVTAASAGLSYLAVWPLETLKNLAQSGTPHPNATLRDRIAYLGGPLGLFRGVVPGVLSGGLRNGCAMVAMTYAQHWASRLGLR